MNHEEISRFSVKTHLFKLVIKCKNCRNSEIFPFMIIRLSIKSFFVNSFSTLREIKKSRHHSPGHIGKTRSTVTVTAPQFSATFPDSR